MNYSIIRENILKIGATKNDVTQKFETDMTVGGAVKLGMQISNGSCLKFGDMEKNFS